MRNNPEYKLYKQIATYLRYQYPRVLYHFDPTGLNLSKAQSGMLKAIQCNKGFPDLIIYHACNGYNGLALELKPEGARLFTKDGRPATPHIAEQIKCITILRERWYRADFAVGFDMAKIIIDNYLKPEK